MRRVEDHIRADAATSTGHQLVVRGSPNTHAKLRETARRMATQYTWHDRPCHGVSAHVVAQDAVDQLLRTTAYLTRHSYAVVDVAEVVAQFVLLATFSDPAHFTLVLDPYNETTVAELADLLTHQRPNPHYIGRSSA